MSPTTNSAPISPRGLRVAGGARRGERRGLTLIELLVATVILSVALAGLLSAWLFSVKLTVENSDATAALQCARLVMERARSLGYVASGWTPVPTNSVAVWDPVGQWQSPAKQRYRFFSPDLVELAYNDGQTMPPPPQAAYVAVTQITYPGPPAARDDLVPMNIEVDVFAVDRSGVVAATPLITLQNIVSEGGL